MKKKSLFLIFGLLFINLVSAYPATLQNLLDELDPSTAILGSLFLIFFLLINYVLSKTFKGQKGIAGIIAFILSFMIIYTINRSGFDYQNIYYDIFYGIGLPSEVASTILPLLLLAAAIFIIWKFSFGTLLLVTGIFIFGYGLLGFAYERGITMIIGAVIAIIGFWIRNKKKHSVDSSTKKPLFEGRPTLNPNWKGNLKNLATAGVLKRRQEKAQQQKQEAKAQQKIETEKKIKEEKIAKYNAWKIRQEQKKKAEQFAENAKQRQDILKLKNSWNAVRPSFIAMGESKDPRFKEAYKELKWKYDKMNHPKHPDVEKVLGIIQGEINRIYRNFK